jgi:hypothetical protein
MFVLRSIHCQKHEIAHGPRLAQKVDGDAAPPNDGLSCERRLSTEENRIKAGTSLRRRMLILVYSLWSKKLFDVSSSS